MSSSRPRERANGQSVGKTINHMRVAVSFFCLVEVLAEAGELGDDEAPNEAGQPVDDLATPRVAQAPVEPFGLDPLASKGQL